MRILTNCYIYIYILLAFGLVHTLEAKIEVAHKIMLRELRRNRGKCDDPRETRFTKSSNCVARLKTGQTQWVRPDQPYLMVF